jgi:hypothetical protein
MNLIDFLQAGGYRLKQATLGKMQAAYFEILKAFVSYFGMPDVGNFIISGCTIDGANITPGMLYIDGELCSFAGGPGTTATEIKKQVTINNLAFKNGSNLPVFRSTMAVIDPTGTPLEDFVRIPTVKEMTWANISGIPASIVYDADYVHTDVNFTDLLKTKLDGLAPPDWSINDPETPGYIANKPAGDLMTVLHKGNYEFADISTDANLTVSFSDIGTDEYMVFGSLVSEGTWNNDNDLIWMVREKTATSFKLLLREVTGNVQNVSFDFMITSK